MLAPSTLVPQHLGTRSTPSVPSRHLYHLVSTFSAFHYEHLQHLQPLFHYPNCFSQRLVVKFDAPVLFFKFYRKVLRKAVKIVEKWLKMLKVRKVLIVKCAEGAEGADRVSRCWAGAEVPGCWVPALTPLISQQSIVIVIGSHWGYDTSMNLFFQYTVNKKSIFMIRQINRRITPVVATIARLCVCQLYL